MLGGTLPNMSSLAVGAPASVVPTIRWKNYRNLLKGSGLKLYEGARNDPDVVQWLEQNIRGKDNSSWFLASAGGVRKTGGQTRKQRLASVAAEPKWRTRSWSYESRQFLYVLFEVFASRPQGTPMQTFWNEKATALELVDYLQQHDIARAWLWYGGRLTESKLFFSPINYDDVKSY